MCRDDRRVKNVSAELSITTTSEAIMHVISVTWSQNASAAVPTSFRVSCENDFNSIQFLVSNQTTTATAQLVAGLLHSSSYSCCVAGVYRDVYTANEICTRTLETSGHVNSISGDSNSTTVVGGVLGFIIIILLVLLIISTVALVCLLRPRLKNSAIYGRYVVHIAAVIAVVRIQQIFA